MKKEMFVILRPRRAESRLALSLVKDAGGSVVERDRFGVVVQVKRSVGKALNLLQIIRTNSLDVVMSSQVSSSYASSAAAHI